ncbi:MAG: LPS export ABC transporter periplasmic protein LptC [Candidatus Latescibacteria bacterium]|nr:LPS export ABC transporter periplasmic protein LptC [Candidatus Latescibacterota bacterium]
MNKFRIIYCVLTVLLFVITAGCEIEEEVPVSIEYNLPDQEFKDARIIITENSITSAIVMAKLVNVFEDDNYTVVQDSIAMEFFNKQGKRVSTLTARNGEVWGLYEQVDSLKATGDVVIISEERRAKLETQSIRWNAKTRMIHADGWVRLSTEDAVQEGEKFVATDDLKNYTMENVTGSIRREGIKVPER